MEHSYVPNNRTFLKPKEQYLRHVTTGFQHFRIPTFADILTFWKII
jgi:hypothetical protein